MSKLECILCDEQFTEQDIYALRYFIQSKICYKCYKFLYKASNGVSCFGKQYSSSAEECRSICPDRKVCIGFYDKSVFKARKQLIHIQPIVKSEEQVTTRKYPFRTNTIIDKAFKMCIKGLDKSKLKKWCAKHGTGYYRVLHTLRSGKRHGKIWRVIENKKEICIGYDV